MPPSARRKPASSTGGTKKSGLPLRKIVAKKPVRFTAFIYGFSGAGKTYLLRDIADPTLGPALAMVCDEGHASFQDLISDDKITAVSTTNLEDITKMFNWLAVEDEAGRMPYRTIVIDNVTELHRDTLRWHAEKRASGNSGKNSYEHTQSDYGNARTQVLAMIAAFVKTFHNVNFVVTATASRIVDASTGMVSIDPGLPGKLSQEIPGFFDLVGYLERRQPHPGDVRKAKTEGRVLQPTGVLLVDQTNTVSSARCRGGVYRGEVSNPSLVDFYTKFTGVK